MSVSFFFVKQKTAYELRIRDWSSDVCSSDLLEADAELWREIGDDPGHPQFGMAQLLERLGIDRGAVAPWAEDAVPEVIPARGRFANLALRPPGGTARWHRVTPGSFAGARSEEHTSELQSLMRNSYAVFCL